VKPFRPSEFGEALRKLGVVNGTSKSSIIRRCDAGLIACDRVGPQRQRRIPARELRRVAALHGIAVDTALPQG